jgi:hypothetical protein
MRIVLCDFMSLDGVVQAPGGPGEDTDGGRRPDLYLPAGALTKGPRETTLWRAAQ